MPFAFPLTGMGHLPRPDEPTMRCEFTRRSARLLPAHRVTGDRADRRARVSLGLLSEESSAPRGAEIAGQARGGGRLTCLKGSVCPEGLDTRENWLEATRSGMQITAADADTVVPQGPLPFNANGQVA